MPLSDFRYFKIPDSIKTAGHSKNWVTGSVYQRPIYPYTREHAPSSTLNSSALELSHWMIGFLKSLDSSQDHITEMLKPSVPDHPYIGLGFQLTKIQSQKVVGHYGGDKGFRSYLIMLPATRIGLVVLANCDYNEDFRSEILHPIAKLMLNEVVVD